MRCLKPSQQCCLTTSLFVGHSDCHTAIPTSACLPALGWLLAGLPAPARSSPQALKTSVSSGGNPLTRSRDSDPHASQRQSAERVPTLQTDTDADLAAGATGDDADVAAAAADVALVAVTALPPRQVVGSPPRASVLRPLPDVRTPPRYPEGVMDADAEGRGGADVIGLDRLGRMMAAVGLTQDTPPSMRGAEEEPGERQWLSSLGRDCWD